MKEIDLYPGEEKIFSTVDTQEIEGTTDQEINSKYVKGEVRIITEQARYPLHSIVTMLDSGDYKLDPEFQRRHRWDNSKKSRLIESFIMNVPVPPIFLYEDQYSHYEVMDGLQRLSSIYDFYKDNYALADLEKWPELNGRTYSQLPDKIKKGIDRRYISSIILLQETAKNPADALRLKQLVFERINSGGVTLEPQESRNAIYDGPLNKLCIRLARNKYLCRTWGIPEPETDLLGDNDISAELMQNDRYRKMEDVELVLRFFAYRQRMKNQDGPLKTYLDQFLKNGNLLEQKVLLYYEELFNRTIELVYEVLEEKAFWLWRKRVSGWSWYKRPTTVLYDPIMFVFSQLLEKRSTLISNKQKIKDELPKFYEDNYEKLEGRYTNLADMVNRNNIFSDFFVRFS